MQQLKKDLKNKIALRYFIIYVSLALIMGAVGGGRTVNYLAMMFYAVPLTWLSLKAFKVKE